MEHDRAPDDGAASGLADRYEELRSAASGGMSGGNGLALFSAKGMAHWMSAWRQLAPVPASAPQPVGGPLPDDVVAVLAAMATACIGGNAP